MPKICQRLLSLVFSAFLGILGFLLPTSEITAQEVDDFLDLDASFFLTQPAAGELNEEGDEFSEAVASGDFNVEGFEDLAVGAPGKDGESGAVSIYPGSEDGITEGFYITQADAGEVAEGNDKFGAALVASTMNRGGYRHEDD